MTELKEAELKRLTLLKSFVRFSKFLIQYSYFCIDLVKQDVWRLYPQMLCSLTAALASKSRSLAAVR